MEPSTRAKTRPEALRKIADGFRRVTDAIFDLATIEEEAAPETPTTLTVEDVAHQLEVSSAWVRRECNAGRIRAVRLGEKLWRIESRALAAYVRQRRNQAS